MDGNHGGDYPRKSEFVGSGVPYITAKAIIDDRIELDRAKFLSPNRAAQLRKGFAADGDVIFAHNATVGPVAILRTDEPTVVLGTSLTYYRCDISRLWPAYLAHSMRSRGFVRQYQQVMRQSTRNQVPITMQRTFTHVVPPLSKQQEIAARLDLAEAHSARIRKVYKSMLMQLTELRAAFMAQAFNGDL
jgi:type I restriction enzyme S subunit